VLVRQRDRDRLQARVAAIQRPLADAGGPRDLLHGHVLRRGALQQALGGGQDTFPVAGGVCALSRCHGPRIGNKRTIQLKRTSRPFMRGRQLVNPILVTLAFLVGGLLAVQGAANVQLSRAVRSPLGAATWQLGIAATALILVAVKRRPPQGPSDRRSSTPCRFRAPRRGRPAGPGGRQRPPPHRPRRALHRGGDQLRRRHRGGARHPRRGLRQPSRSARCGWPSRHALVGLARRAGWSVLRHRVAACRPPDRCGTDDRAQHCRPAAGLGPGGSRRALPAAETTADPGPHRGRRPPVGPSCSSSRDDRSTSR
jgi:hypothetical protein